MRIGQWPGITGERSQMRARRRVGEVDDSFIASNPAGTMTGTVVNLGGGAIMGWAGDTES